MGLLHHPFINAYGHEEMVRRGRILKVEDHPQVVVYAQEMESMQGVLEETRYRLLRSGLLTLGAVALAIFWIIRRTLRPLERFTENLAARSTEAGAALPDIPENLPEELFPLAVAFNSTLEKVEIARAHERDFTFSAAHQMRTPVAGIHAILELAHAKSGDSPDLHQRIGSALMITREMRTIINSLMKLVRIRGGD